MYPSYGLFPALFPPPPVIGGTGFNPLIAPLVAVPSTIGRSAAATFIVLPQTTTPVTAYAPLGTLNLTPSTLVFLILFLTLPE